MADEHVDPELVRIWLTGWTIARETPRPVRYEDGFRVDVGWPEQRARFVFPALTPSVAALAAEVREPWVFLKVCTASEGLAEVAGGPWRLQDERSFMRTDADMPLHPPPEPYRLETAGLGSSWLAQVRTADGEVVARAGLACVEGFAIYDRIETDAGHRRRGLASALMGALGGIARRAGTTQGLLVATAAGRPLYERLGWSVRSPYASAVIPAPS